MLHASKLLPCLLPLGTGSGSGAFSAIFTSSALSSFSSFSSSSRVVMPLKEKKTSCQIDHKKSLRFCFESIKSLQPSVQLVIKQIFPL